MSFDHKNLRFPGHFAIAFLPVPIWAWVLGSVANPDPGNAKLTAFVMTLSFVAGLLILKPLVIGFGAVLLGRSLWAHYKGRKADDRLEWRALRVIGLLYAPVFGCIALAVGVWDGWDGGGWSPVKAGLAYGAVGFFHTLVAHRSILVAALGVMVLAESGEGSADGGAASTPRRVEPPAQPRS